MKAIRRWGYRKLLFYKGGQRWGNPAECNVNLQRIAVTWKTFFSPYFILRVIAVRQEVVENVDSFESQWKQLSLLKNSFQFFHIERLQTQNLTKILTSKALTGILIHMTVCNLEYLGNKPSRLWNKPPCSYFTHEKIE